MVRFAYETGSSLEHHLCVCPQLSLEFLRVTFGNVAEDERRKVREQLERYCGQDTEGMIWIVDALHRLVGQKSNA